MIQTGLEELTDLLELGRVPPEVATEIRNRYRSQLFVRASDFGRPYVALGRIEDPLGSDITIPLLAARLIREYWRNVVQPRPATPQSVRARSAE